MNYVKRFKPVMAMTRGRPCAIVYGGIDRGLVKMSQTVVFTEYEIELFSAYPQSAHNDGASGTAEERRLWRIQRTKDIRIPTPFTIDARNLRHRSHLNKTAKSREEILRGRDDVLETFNRLSEHSVRKANMPQIDQAAATYTESFDQLYDFNMTPALLHDTRHAESTKRRALQRLCANERSVYSDAIQGKGAFSTAASMYYDHAFSFLLF